MKSKILFSILFLWVFGFSEAQIDTLYFNKDWKVTTKDSAEFYRPKPIKTTIKKALGYKIKNIDSLYIIKDFYVKNNQLQYVGFSTDKEGKKILGCELWYNEDGSKIDYQKNYERHPRKLHHFFTQHRPIITIDYQYINRHSLKIGTEFLLNKNSHNKVFLGIGYGAVNYNKKIYGIWDYHLSYNLKKGGFFKIGGSQNHIYALGGLSILNVIDFGIGYSVPFSNTQIPEIKGFTIGLTLRITKNNNAYAPMRISW